MKWEGQRQSDNVEDRRGQGGGMFGGGGMRPRVGGKGIGLGTIVIAMLAAWIFGINPFTVLGVLGGAPDAGPVAQQPAPQAPQGPTPPSQDAAGAFVRTVLADTEDVWNTMFRQAGAQYREPRLVLFEGATRSGCGVGQSAMGPFYCPADQSVYLDTEFFATMSRRMGAPGDFAAAYVIAHEVAHHVQRLMGITDKVDAMRGRMSEVQNNALSVRVELQADCLAGVWTNHSNRGKNWLEHGDIEEAINAASKIGDDHLQKQSQGVVIPERFTHGSSAQRMRWFQRGLQSGQVASCNTFEAQQL